MTTILAAMFIFAYQGAEVSISGWVTSFLTSYHHSARSSAAFFDPGFWGGIALGRYMLSHPAHKFSENMSILFQTMGAIALQLLIWLNPNAVGGAIRVSFVGLVLGLIYPCATAVFSNLVPTDLRISSLSVISALGSSEGAMAPLVTGLLARESGTWVLHPICVAPFLGMMSLWTGLPIDRKARG